MGGVLSLDEGRVLLELLGSRHSMDDGVRVSKRLPRNRKRLQGTNIKSRRKEERGESANKKRA